MKVGYVIASHEVTKAGKKIGYLYRERPDSDEDSGWRVFSGEESQEYSDDPSNFSMYNASTIIGMDPAFVSIIGRAYPVAFERDFTSDAFIEILE